MLCLESKILKSQLLIKKFPLMSFQSNFDLNVIFVALEIRKTANPRNPITENFKTCVSEKLQVIFKIGLLFLEDS